jgi:hypothetical protein
VTTQELLDRTGHRFPGGSYRIEHWENWLLTDCTGADQLPDGLVHPVALFHVPIQGARTSIAELFALFAADGLASVSIEGYDWEYFQPLREHVEYRVEGGITEMTRHTAGSGQAYDAVAFQIDLFDGEGRAVARITNRWRIHRAAA